jgi:hypothetical protein
MPASVPRPPESPSPAAAHRPPLETPDALLAAGVSKPVFDCQWPETRRLVRKLWAALPEGLSDRLYDEPYRGGQDAMQNDFVDAWLAWRAPVVALDAAALPWRYATMGSTEGIRESLALHAMHGFRAGNRQPTIHAFEGEYEGYAAEAEGYGVRVVRHDRRAYEESLLAHAAPGDRLYLSQPSAIDGNVWAGFPRLVAFVEERLPALALMVDLTYVGTVGAPYAVDVRSPVVHTVFFSLSKVFGVYYHRVGGALSRAPLTGLYGNRWFKNTFSLELGRRLLESFSVQAIPRRYAAQQAKAVESVAAKLGVPAVASDVVLLANHDWREGLPAAVAPLRRGASVRYCLTPALDRLLHAAAAAATDGGDHAHAAAATRALPR